MRPPSNILDFECQPFNYWITAFSSYLSPIHASVVAVQFFLSTRHQTYGECSMLTNILAKSSDAASIPVACRFDEGNNVGRVHSQHSNQTLYNLSRRMTKSFCPEGIAVEHTGLHHNDAPQSGSISFGECQTLATHLHQTFGVTSLLPKSCAELLAKAKGST